MERGLIKTSVGYIHYRAVGNGPALVLIHGQVKSSAMFIELLDALAGDMRVIAVDLPSCGSSDHVPAGLRMPDYARVVVEVLRVLGVQQMSVLGQAAGSRVATHIALAHPDIVNKIILTNCAWWGTKEEEQRSRPARNAVAKPLDETGIIQTRTLEEYLRIEPGHCPKDPPQSWAERVNLAALEAGTDCMQLGDASHEDDWTQTLPRVTRPVLNLWGEHFIYTRFATEFAALSRDNATSIIPGARFDPWVDHPDAVRAEILSFLA